MHLYFLFPCSYSTIISMSGKIQTA
jgi:hypothetical protein